MSKAQQAFAAITQNDIDRLWSKIEVKGPDDCWPWLARNTRNDGRGCFKLNEFPFHAPRLVLALRDGFLPAPSVFACHSCDNPPCCNPSHLWWGSPLDNARDAAQKNRMHRWNGHRAGSANPRAKLTESDVLKIRNDKRVRRLIAADFGISQATVSYIKSYKIWQDLGVCHD